MLHSSPCRRDSIPPRWIPPSMGMGEWRNGGKRDCREVRTRQAGRKRGVTVSRERNLMKAQEAAVYITRWCISRETTASLLVSPRPHVVWDVPTPTVE